MAKRRLPQQYSPEEFDAAVKLIQSNADLRADIEAITGQKLDKKTPRELFDLYRAIQTATDIQVTEDEWVTERRRRLRRAARERAA